MAEVWAVSASPTSGAPVAPVMKGAPVGTKFTDSSVNVRLAIRSVVNLPVPRILWMTPRGLVSTLGLSEKSLPSSVPASHG